MPYGPELDIDRKDEELRLQMADHSTSTPHAYPAMEADVAFVHIYLDGLRDKNPIANIPWEVTGIKVSIVPQMIKPPAYVVEGNPRRYARLDISSHVDDDQFGKTRGPGIVGFYSTGGWSI